MPNHVDLSYMSERVWSGNNSSGIDHDCEPDENGMDTDFTPLVEQHSWIFNGLLTIFVILLIVVGVILPFWNIYQQKQCVRQEEHRRRVSIKIAGPIREKYLYDLMKDFSKVCMCERGAVPCCAVSCDRVRCNTIPIVPTLTNIHFLPSCH